MHKIYIYREYLRTIYKDKYKLWKNELAYSISILFDFLFFSRKSSIK